MNSIPDDRGSDSLILWGINREHGIQQPDFVKGLLKFPSQLDRSQHFWEIGSFGFKRVCQVLKDLLRCIEDMLNILNYIYLIK